jgi:hypothetical protein
MNLFARDMKLDIHSNEGERISNCIVCDNAFFFMNAMKIDVSMSNLWANYIGIKKKTMSHRMREA